MNTLKWLILSVIVFVVFGGLSAAFIAVTPFDKKIEHVTFDDYKSFDANNIQNIDAQLVSQDVRVIQTNDTNITLEHKGYCEYSYLGKKGQEQTPTFVMEQSGTTISAHMQEPEWNFRTLYTNCQKTVTIKIPQDYANKLSIQTVSGDIAVLPMSLDELDFTVVSGDVNSEANATHTTVKSVSGDVDIISPTYADISTVSGDVTLHSPQTLRVTVDTVSGDTTGNIITTSTSTIYVQTVSGDIRVE